MAAAEAMRVIPGNLIVPRLWKRPRVLPLLVAAVLAGFYCAHAYGAGMTPESIDTKATVSLDKGDAGFSVTSSHLDTTVKIPNANKAAFDEAVQKAKAGCPISKLLNATITLDAKLI